MFALCCTVNISPKGEAEKSHFNPIYLKLGGRKKKTKDVKVELKTEQTLPTKQSFIYGCGFSNVEETSRHERATSQLGQSVCFRTHQTVQKSHLTTLKDRVQYEQTLSKSLQKQLKYSRLQDKYISVLEKTNHFLQETLRSNEKNGKSRSKSKNTKPMRTQLQELKNRLNNIDLTGIKKLAKVKTRSQSQDCSLIQDKQNRIGTAFKELRSKIQ